MMDTKTFLGSNSALAFLLLVLTGSLSGNVVQLYRYERLTHPTELGVRLGAVLRPFVVVGRDGKRTQLDFSGSKPTVIYVMSPLCGWCKRNQANITSLALQKARDYQFVGLSTTDNQLKDFWKSTKLPFPVYSVPSADVLSRYHLGDETPQMAIVDSAGRVGRVWHGALSGDGLTEVEKYFGVRLPGLADLVIQEGGKSKASAKGT